MRRFVYASFSPTALALGDLLRLLDAARRRNAQDGITGLLLVRDDFFLQLLEGPSSALESLRQRLLRDPRHQGMTILSDRLISGERLFPNWQMGFHHLTAIEGVAPDGLLGNHFRVDEVITPACLDDPAGRIVAEFFRTHRSQIAGGVRRLSTV